jgi:hypothetical protein
VGAGNSTPTLREEDGHGPWVVGKMLLQLLLFFLGLNNSALDRTMRRAYFDRDGALFEFTLPKAQAPQA